MSNYTLHLGDCLEYMRGMADKSVDIVITDPPFNAGKEFPNDNLTELEFRAFVKKFTLALYDLKPKSILIEVGKDDCIVRQELDKFFKFEYSICLNYTNSMRNGKIGFSNWGLVLWYSIGGKCYKRYKDRLDSALHDTRDEFSHPSPKEVDHYKKLVSMFSLEGDTIFDPFMGSGTTGVACMQLGRNFIGVEIDKDYFRIAEKRITQAQAQLAIPFTEEAGETELDNRSLV